MRENLRRPHCDATSVKREFWRALPARLLLATLAGNPPAPAFFVS
jgi:hypothetical protein